MKTLKNFFLIFFLIIPLFIYAQVGIGTTTPDASSVLDVIATDKGILIPRVSLSNVTTTMLDGTNTAATGLLIYNTNNSVIGGNGVGYYYFNGTQWEQIRTSLTSNDHDWYEEGTTNEPNSINDDIYTQGNVAIGKTTADYALDLNESVLSRGINVNLASNSTGDLSGIVVRNLGTGSGLHHGVYNDMRFGNGAKFGVRNDLSGTGFLLTGVVNNMIGTGNGDYMATNNFVNASGSGDKFGSFNRISSSSGGDLYGVYSDVLRNSGREFSGFFVGNFAIGTERYDSTTPNHYILPASRGTANQVMQTDGSGNVSWVDETTIGTDDQNISGSGLSGTTLTIGIENGTSETVNLASLQDGTGTDDQNISGSGLSGTTLTIGIENGTSETVDLASLQDGTGTDDQNLSGATLTGNTLQIDIENGTSTSVDLSSLNTGGDITGVTAGTGLTGGGTTGAVILNVVANNGLTTNANDIVLGGILTQATTIAQGTNNMVYNLNSSGDFLVQDNGNDVFEVRDNGITYFGSDTFWKDVDTGGTNIGAFIDDGDDGRFLIYENGILSVDLDANTGFVFNEQGLDRDFRIESDDESSMFRVDAGNNRIGVMEATPNFDIHLKQSNLTAASAGGIAFESSATSNNWKIYHSGSNISFAENGVRRAYITAGTGAYVATSDRRLKKSITDVESILEKVNNLKAYRYLYKDQDFSAKNTLGFMAQDVQVDFPELVETGEDGYLGLNYSGFGVVAIKAIQEQQEIIDVQQKQIEDLKKENENTNKLLTNLLKRIERLENQN